MKNLLSGIFIALLFSNISIAKDGVSDTLALIRMQRIAGNPPAEKIYSESYLMNLFASQLYINKGLYKQKEQNYTSAISNFQEAIKLNPASFEAYKYIGEAKVALGLKTEAMEAFDKAIDLNPFYGEAYFKKATLLKMNGNYQEAYNNYSMAMYIDPAYTHAFVQKDLDVLSFCNFIKKNYQLNVSGK